MFWRLQKALDSGPCFSFVLEAFGPPEPLSSPSGEGLLQRAPEGVPEVVFGVIFEVIFGVILDTVGAIKSRF